MELKECVERRRSVRSFSAEDVPEAILEEALRLATLAPSAGNLQARDFVVVSDPATKARLAEAALNQGFVADAPTVIVCCANLERIAPYGPRGRDLYCLQDVAAAAEHIALYLAGEGYGCCWVGAFDEAAVSAILSLPRGVRPVTMLPVGKPLREGQRPSRMPLSEVVHRDRW